MSVERTIKLSILELGHIETALEAYIEDAVDSRMHMEEGEEHAELGVIVDEGQALLARIQTALGRPVR